MTNAKSIEVSAKTVDEAIQDGLNQLALSREDVEIEVLEEGSKGLFGLFGSKLAQVRLTVKNNEMQDVEQAFITEQSKEQEKQCDCCCNKVEKQARPVVSEVSQEQIDFAKNFLQTITERMNVSVDIDAQKSEEGNLVLSMHGDELGILIGRHGETLDALQYLTSLAVNKNSDSFVRVIVDSENYREKRVESLKRLANKSAAKVLKTGRKLSLEPMNPYERRILHSALQADDRIQTHSEGTEPYRRVVISLRK